MNKQYCPYCMNPVEEGEVCPSCGLTAGNYEPSLNHLPPGTMLENRYLIGRVLGEGGFGITYIGCDTKLEMKVAIKEYYPAEKVQRISHVSLDLSVPSAQASAFFEAGKQRFLQEALIMAQMDKQPEIVGVRDFFECHNTAYIVMEFVEGTTFKQLVEQRGGGIPAAELLPLVKPLFGALSNFHEKGLIHRDISPDNLMLERGAVRLLDFGCARQPERGDTTMTIVLKHGYAPIEQYTNRGQGPWTDVYALGATLYFCLVGKRPPQAMDRAVEDELILPRKLGVDLTEEQEKALMRAMGVKRSQRFASMEEFHAALYHTEPQPQQPLRLQLQIRSVLKNSEDRSGFSYELVDDTGRVLKTASTDPHGQASFVLTFGPETAGYTYTYTIRQIDPQRPNVSPSTEQYTLSALIRIRNGTLCAELQSNGMPVSQEQVFVFHNVLRKKRKTKKSLPGWAEPVLVLGAVAAILTALILPPMLKKAPEALPPVTAPETENQDPSAEVNELEQLFAGAEEFTGDTAAALHDYLAEQTRPVILREGTVWLDCSRIGQIRAPILVAEHAALMIEDPLALEAPLVLQGQLELQSPMRIRGDGVLYLQTGCDFRGQGMVLLEDWQSDVSGRRQDSLEAGICYINFAEHAIPEDAVHVSTEQELRTKVHVGVVVVDGHIVLTENLPVEYTLIVAEGASLTGPMDQETWISLIGQGKLLNYGTVSGCININEQSVSTLRSMIYNAGELNGRLYLRNHTNVLNTGVLRWYGVQVFESARVYNEGHMELPVGQWGATMEESILHNYGQLTVCSDLDIGGRLVNRGSMTLQDSANVYNHGYLCNQGNFLQTAGTDLENHGILELAGAMTREKGGEVHNVGVIQLNDWGQQQLQAAEPLPGTVIHMIDSWAGEHIAEAADTESFLAALNDGAVDAVSIVGPVTLEQDVSLWKNICVQPGGTLTVEGQLESKMLLHNYGDIRTEYLRMTERGQIVNGGTITVSGNLTTEDGCGVLNYGTVQLQQGTITLTNSAVMNYGDIRDFSSLNVMMGTVLAQYGTMRTENAQVLVKNAVLAELDGGSDRYDSASIRLEQNSLFTIGDSMFWNDLQLYVDESSEVASWFVQVEQAENARIENHGLLHNYGYEEHVFRIIGRLENYGQVQIRCPMELLGTMDNQGTLEQLGPELLRILGGRLLGNAIGETHE